MSFSYTKIEKKTHFVTYGTRSKIILCALTIIKNESAKEMSLAKADIIFSYEIKIIHG
jgi:hypothetical protein